MLKDEAPRLGYTIADTYAAFAEEPEERLLRPEKIHPNAKGHTLIAEVLYKAYQTSN
jgi:lysophospholipase L1-like esterase